MPSNVYKNLIDFGDSLIERLGNVLNALMIALVCVVIVVVVGRYFFEIGSVALQELTTYLHATIFMLGISYTLKHDGHVRVDIFYRNFSEKKQALINIIGGLMFVFPISIFIGWSSWEYVLASWSIMETSTENNGLPFIYLLKTVMLIMPSFLMIQGLVIIVKNSVVLYSSSLKSMK